MRLALGECPTKLHRGQKGGTSVAMSQFNWGFVILGLVVAGIVWWFLRYARPQFPPLNTAADEALLLEAYQKATASLSEFRSLLERYPKNAIIKLKFVSNSNQVEHLWAEVLEPISETEYRVRLVTPPVTHSGKLDRLYICKEEDIEDWQVTDDKGKHHGAFSQRAMYAIARRDGVTLPKKLLAMEKFYK
jgi:uncharacterized protein YegJ (DUF2314 family)